MSSTILVFVYHEVSELFLWFEGSTSGNHQTTPGICRLLQVGDELRWCSLDGWCGMDKIGVINVNNSCKDRGGVRKAC